MMTAATVLGRALIVLTLFAGAFAQPARAQETIRLATTAGTRDLLRQAEALLARGDASAAFKLLAPRESDLAGHAYFDYLLGIAALDTGRTAEAILSLERSAATAPQFAGARMELARAHFDAGDRATARPIFESLLNENPPSTVRDVIDAYLSAITAGPAAPPGQVQAYAELFAGHDSNANGSTNQQQFLGFVLSPENLETDSPFLEAGAGIDWLKPVSAGFAWLAGGRAGIRKNPDASFVDSGIVSALAGTSWRGGPVFGHAIIDAYQSSRDGHSNESYGGLALSLGRHLNERWDISLDLRAGALRYGDAIEILDVNRKLYTLGFAYRFPSAAQLRFEVVGGNDDEQKSASPYGNSKFGSRLSFGSPVGQSNYLSASVGSLSSDYDGLFFGSSREDTQVTSMLQFEFRNVITDGLTIAPRLRYMNNESEVSLYDYDRTEIGLLLRWAP